MAQIRDKKFERQLRKYLKVVDKEGTKGIRSVSLQALKMVMRKSPVDYGTFRGNWNVGINEINETFQTDFTVKPAKGRYDQASFSRGSTVVGAIKGGEMINISNSLPYSMRLEYGWSKQASSGMVRVTLKELEGWLRKQNKKV